MIQSCFSDHSALWHFPHVHPRQWGVLITFIELIKNPRYSFWSHSFTHCAPELERVFESVARSCMTPGASGAVAGAEDDGTAAGTAQ